MILENFIKGYLEAALFTSNDLSDDTPLDKLTISDFSPEALARAKKDCDLFVRAGKEFLDEAKMDDAAAGHDFWLTRNGHGAGFWDRDLGDVGDRLTELCKFFGETDLYLGDDRQLHFN